MRRPGFLRGPLPALLMCLACGVAAGDPVRAGDGGDVGHVGNPPRVAIIIDDLGHVQSVGERVIALPGPVACAILPGTPRARSLARQAHVFRKEVLLHLPMQAANVRGDVAPGTLSLDMDRDDVMAAVGAALAAVPYAIGVNNHQGSLLTRHPGHMQWVMDELRTRPPLFFIDSYTTHRSVALRIAAESGVAAMKRDVFLDTDPAPERIRAELARLVRLAKAHGSAVAIGHPYEATLAVLEAELPRLADAGVRLVPISELVTNSGMLAYSNKDPQRTRQEGVPGL